MSFLLLMVQFAVCHCATAQLGYLLDWGLHFLYMFAKHTHVCVSVWGRVVFALRRISNYLPADGETAALGWQRCSFVLAVKNGVTPNQGQSLRTPLHYSKCL